MEIIGRIYEALDDDEALEALPDLIAKEIGSRSCTFQMFDSDFRIERMVTNHFSNDMDRFYIENDIHRHDEWANAVKAGNLNKSIRISDFVSDKELLKSFFFNEFIRRFGDDSLHCVTFASTRADGGLVAIGLHKGRKDSDFTRQQVRLLEAFRPHLTRMAVLRRNLIDQKEAASGAMLGVNQIEDAYLVLHPDRKVAFANAAAEMLLANADLLQVAKGRLSLQHLQDDEKLGCALSDANLNNVKSNLSFIARDRSGAAWRFTLAPKAFEGHTLILVWIDRCQASASAPQAMQQIYGLTQAELPVLMAVSEGRSAIDIADRLQISIATVRTHLQHIYQKTGVNKATQLATMVSTLPKVR